MNIYLVSRKNDDEVGYDEYGGFVCYAESSEKARQMKPWGEPDTINEHLVGYYERYDRQLWPVKQEDLTCEYLGVVDYLCLKPRVILSDFRAG